MTRTLQRPFKNHLPPTGKAIPPPKISDNYTPKTAPATTASSRPMTNGNGTISPPPLATAQPQCLPPPTLAVTTAGTITTTTSSATPLPPPPPSVTTQMQTTQSPVISPSMLADESNYAVTEL